MIASGEREDEQSEERTRRAARPVQDSYAAARKSAALAHALRATRRAKRCRCLGGAQFYLHQQYIRRGTIECRLGALPARHATSKAMSLLEWRAVLPARQG
jgi:hypothetical protein